LAFHSPEASKKASLTGELVGVQKVLIARSGQSILSINHSIAKLTNLCSSNPNPSEPSDDRLPLNLECSYLLDWKKVYFFPKRGTREDSSAKENLAKRNEWRSEGDYSPPAPSCGELIGTVEKSFKLGRVPSVSTCNTPSNKSGN
jgi:hypothetical protein